MKRILIVAGEASADRYGARLARKLRTLHPGDSLRFFGTGGDAMEREGIQLLCHIRLLASIGPREALAHFRVYYETFQKILRSCLDDPPAVAVLLDFPEFNLRLAKKMKRAGVRVIYYISPQLWAWRSGRIHIIRDYVDQMLVILPFEEKYYRERGVNAQFVGHPLLEDFAPESDRESFLRCINLVPGRKTIALLPGSRRREVRFMLPTLIRAARRILEKMPAQFIISAAPSVSAEEIRRLAAQELAGDPNALYFKIEAGIVAVDRLENFPLRQAVAELANADFGIVKSGTSTLEAALVGVPFVIVYKISNISWHVGNFLVRSPFKGLVNLIAEKQIVPEFFQGDATPEALSGAVLEYFERPQRLATMRSGLSEIREKLSLRCASDAVAAVVERYL